MKKILRILAIGALGASMFGGVASAASCNISNTGTGSNNTCTVSNTTTVTLTCTNGIQTNTVNTQNAVSGSVTADGNTFVGEAISGNAENVSALAIDLVAGCASAAVVPGSPIVPTQPEVKVAVAEPTPGEVQAVQALPATGESNPIAVVAIVGAIAAAVALVTRLGLTSYRRFGLK